MKIFSNLLVALFIVLGAASLSSCGKVDWACPPGYVDAYPKGKLEVVAYKNQVQVFTGVLSGKDEYNYLECEVDQIVITSLEDGSTVRVTGALHPLNKGDIFIVNIPKN